MRTNQNTARKASTLTVFAPTSMALVGLALAPNAQAQAAWNGTVSGDWLNPANSTPSNVPTSADDAVIGDTSVNTVAAPTVQFGAGTSRIQFNHTTTKYAFDAAISGAGTIYQNLGEGTSRRCRQNRRSCRHPFRVLSAEL